MAVPVSNLGTQNRDFTVLTWVLKLLPSRSEMVRFRSKVKTARVGEVKLWVYKEYTSIYMHEFGPSCEKNENQILTQFEPKSTSIRVRAMEGDQSHPKCPFHPKVTSYTRRTPPVGLDGRGLGFEHP